MNELAPGRIALAALFIVAVSPALVAWWDQRFLWRQKARHSPEALGAMRTALRSSFVRMSVFVAGALGAAAAFPYLLGVQDLLAIAAAAPFLVAAVMLHSKRTKQIAEAVSGR